jgi:hypothetical protein
MLPHNGGVKRFEVLRDLKYSGLKYSAVWSTWCFEIKRHNAQKWSLGIAFRAPNTINEIAKVCSGTVDI